MQTSGPDPGDHGSAPGAAQDGVEPRIVQVVDSFGRLLERDGAHLDILGVEHDVLRVRFVAGPGGCDMCAFTPSDLEQLMADALVTQGSTVTTVTVVE